MAKFEFTVIADGVDLDDDAFEDRFFEAGCSDALISIVKGNVVLDFTREAKNLAHAVATALRDVHRAGARARRIEPDSYVSMSDIAERAGLTRQAVSLFVSGERGAGDFPPPALRVTTDLPLWDWLTVARWLYRHRKLADRHTLVFAAMARELNLRLACVNAEPIRGPSIERFFTTA